MDTQTVLKLATLARLELSPEEAEDCATQLSRFLTHAEQLTKVPIEREDAELVAVKGRASTPLRADVVTGSDGQADALAGSPLTHDGYYVVPRVLE